MTFDETQNHFKKPTTGERVVVKGSTERLQALKPHIWIRLQNKSTDAIKQEGKQNTFNQRYLNE